MTKTNKETEPQPGFHLFKQGDREADAKIRWLTGERHAFVLNVEFKNQAHIKRWCEENCTDTVSYLEDDGYRGSDEIYFYLESDAVAFKLRWL